MVRSNNPIQFGFNPRDLPYQRVVSLVQIAEKAGFDLITLQDRPRVDETEAWTLATALGVQTNRVRLTHGTTNVTYRNPALLAKMAASLDRITQGRVILTLGAGFQELDHTNYGFYFGSGPERFRDLCDAVTIIRGMMSAPETFSYQGRRFMVEAATLEPKPVNGTIPIYLGAIGPRMLRYTGQVADGWLKDGGWPQSAEEYRGLLAQVEAGAERAGRDPATIRRAVNGLGYVGSRDPQEVTANIRPGRSRGLLGTGEDILAQIDEYRNLGIDTFRLQFANEGLEEQLQQFGEEVIARVPG